jgi:CO/xanthine dehydrogenase FAD-binding subunit
MAPRPMRARAVETALEGRPLDAASVAAAVKQATVGCAPLTDPQASAWYRTEVLPVHLRRLLSA